MDKNKPPRAPRNPIRTSEVIADISSSAEFQEGRDRGEPLPLRFGRAAHALALLETYDSGHRTKEGDRLNVASYVDEFTDATEQLAYARRRNAPTDRLRILKRKIIPFNHALKELIDHDPMADMDEVSRFLSEVYTATHRGDLADMSSTERRRKLGYIDNMFSETLSGMRHEIAAHQMLGHLGYDVDDDVTIDDELRGIDMRIISPDENKFTVDIKGSPRKAENARLDDFRKSRLILCTGLMPEDFDGKFRLSPAVVARHSSYFEQEITAERERLGR